MNGKMLTGVAALALAFLVWTGPIQAGSHGGFHSSFHGSGFHSGFHSSFHSGFHHGFHHNDFFFHDGFHHHHHFNNFFFGFGYPFYYPYAYSYYYPRYYYPDYYPTYYDYPYLGTAVYPSTSIVRIINVSAGNMPYADSVNGGTSLKTQPAPLAPSPDATYPYDGGPIRPIPMPRVQPPASSVPADGRAVSLTSAKSKYSFVAYGEEPTRTKSDRTVTVKKDQSKK